MTEIKLGSRLYPGLVALVDDEDADRVLKFHWSTRKSKRTMYCTTTIDGRSVTMHAFIAGEKHVDHRDNNGLNNQKGNLRRATKQQNNQNRRPNESKASSRFKGVFNPSGYRYTALIYHNGRRYNLGSFLTEREAALAYDEAARKLFGEFAWTNFPSGTSKYPEGGSTKPAMLSGDQEKQLIKLLWNSLFRTGYGNHQRRVNGAVVTQQQLLEKISGIVLDW